MKRKNIRNLMKQRRFRKSERIKKTCDINRLFKKGKKEYIFGAKLFFTQNKRNIVRIAFVVSHNFGNAVERNLSKRFCREVFRSFKIRLYEGFDIIFFVYPVEKDSFRLRYGQFEKLCIKANLLKN